MSRRERACFVVLPVVVLVVYHLGLRLLPHAYQWTLSSEQGVVELGTAAFYGIAAGIAVILGLKTRGFVPSRYRIFYILFALAALFAALEEISYGQHLFGWTSPELFAEQNTKGETNLHNLFGSQPGRVLGDLTLFILLFGGIVVPVLVMRRRGQYPRDHWAYYVLPRGELIIVVALATLLRVFRKLPVSAATAAHWGFTELVEFYWAAAALLYAVTLWRRLMSPGSKVDLVPP
jgi:hypothetical protein